MIPTVGYHWKFIGIRPSDPLVIPFPGFRSDPIRSNRARCWIYGPGTVYIKDANRPIDVSDFSNPLNSITLY